MDGSIYIFQNVIMGGSIQNLLWLRLINRTAFDLTDFDNGIIEKVSLVCRLQHHNKERQLMTLLCTI